MSGSCYLQSQAWRHLHHCWEHWSPFSCRWDRWSQLYGLGGRWEGGLRAKHLHERGEFLRESGGVRQHQNGLGLHDDVVIIHLREVYNFCNRRRMKAVVKKIGLCRQLRRKDAMLDRWSIDLKRFQRDWQNTQRIFGTKPAVPCEMGDKLESVRSENGLVLRA